MMITSWLISKEEMSFWNNLLEQEPMTPQRKAVFARIEDGWE